MNTPIRIMKSFLKVIISVQSYLNLIYLLAAFPLGVFYFVFLVSGLSIGISLSIIWIGIPLLLVVGVGWWCLARFERLMAIVWLKEDIPAEMPPQGTPKGIWEYFKAYLTSSVTWKSPVYLLMKFPMGIATFAILVTLISVTLSFLTLPLTYDLINFQVTGFFSPDQSAWQVDSLGEALLGMLIGLFLWPLTLQIGDKLTWIHARFAKVMLSVDNVAVLS